MPEPDKPFAHWHQIHQFHPQIVNGGVGSSLPQVLLLLLIVFCIAMAIHCLTNNRLSSNAKILWLLFIFLVPWIGPLCYFFIGRHSQPAQPYRQRSVPYYQPKQQMRQVFRDYQQGYRAVQQPSSPVQSTKETTNEWQRYEEPQASYPEMPLQEMPPQEL